MNPVNQQAVQSVITMLLQEFGLPAQLYNTGGGCMVYEARLSNGHFIRITEADDFISPHQWRTEGYRDRISGELVCAGENVGNPWGWTVLAYLPAPDDPAYPADEPYAGVIDASAFFSDLSDVVACAMRAAVGTTRTGASVYVHIDRGGTRAVKGTI